MRSLLCLLLSGMSIHAAAPSLDCLYPIAVPRGSTNTIIAVGKFDPWPPKIWTTASGVSFTAETNKGKFQIAVTSDAKPGPYFIRAYNDDGASAPRFLLIADSPELSEKEPNNDFEGAQVLGKLPAIVNARFDKNDDVDTYRLELSQGQTIAARVEAYVLASPVDAVLRLLDSRAVEVAFNHDDGRTLDPEIIYTAPKTGSYFLQAFGFNYPADSNIRFVGNDKCIYRLHVSGPPTNQPFAACVKEAEPNNTASNAMPVDVPGTIGGCIDSPDDEDIFQFAAKKGDKFSLRVESASLGFPVDARLEIRNSKHEEIAKADDSGSVDPALDWAPDNDGIFFASVRNVLHRGGSNYLYRLSIQKPEPTLKATVGDHAFKIEPGKTNKIPVTLKKLYGFDAKPSF
ncbi:MAG TPA: PPC domain-containing protein, partial [Verrucomicrobiae bacterium]|nr:PPC domain-containing protein [Verrucomicrobiae bacterium]